jgi:pyruvate dehydrogenase E2 component (dihydrolipoamide acetyltransferase)
MRVEVVMPQMGESIVEGTIVEWLKQIGDTVDRDEDIFTLSTDKVDAEVPSPEAGVLVEMLAQVGDTIEVGKTVAIIETDASAAAGATPAAAPAAVAPEPAANVAPSVAAKAAPAPAAAPAKIAALVANAAPVVGAADATVEELRKSRSTPLVRKIAAEHGITDLGAIAGTGVSGRVTKKDIMSFIDAGGASSAAASARDTIMTRATQPAKDHSDGKISPAIPPSVPAAPSGPGYQPAMVKVPRVHVYENDRVEKMSRMRASIAENMMQARRGTAHCHTVWEADVTAVMKHRKANKAEYASRGANLTFTAYFVAAVVDGLREFPAMNAAINGDEIVYRGNVNIGVAAAIDTGLIVPVLKHADTLNLLGIAKGVNDIGFRSKNKQLKPADVSDGTFTISNAGIWGSLFGVPILVQPQVGILGIGGVKKRVVADDDDNILIRSIVTMCLTFDHRIIDGATADGFMSHITKRLAGANFS